MAKDELHCKALYTLCLLILISGLQSELVEIEEVMQCPAFSVPTDPKSQRVNCKGL